MDLQWSNDFWNRIEQKLNKIAPLVRTYFPYTTDEKGNYVDFYADKDGDWWTNGFWAGILWQAYLGSGKETYKELAIDCEKALDQAFIKFTGLHHDVGFMWLPSAVAHWKIDGDESAKARGLHAATILAGRFNAEVGFIRAWNDETAIGWGIIDCMMNIPLLYWASVETKDPRFKSIAMKHADTTMEHFVRPDGSVNHIVAFDPVSGEVLETPRGQGYASGSSWSRGQAWAIYGFILSYIHTSKQEYLDTAKKIAHYFIANLSEDGVPVVDFRAPKEPVLKDATAGAIAACGLIEISRCVDSYEKELYLRGAERLLKGLEKNCNFDMDNQSILQNGTERYHDTRGFHIPIIYGDFFLMEALLKLKGDAVLFW